MLWGYFCYFVDHPPSCVGFWKMRVNVAHLVNPTGFSMKNPGVQDSLNRYNVLSYRLFMKKPGCARALFNVYYLHYFRLLPLCDWADICGGAEICVWAYASGWAFVTGQAYVCLLYTSDAADE